MGGREQVKVAIAQVSMPWMDREACVTRACEAIEESGRDGAELIIFPENWLAGYPYWTDGWNSDRHTWIEARVRFFDAAIARPSEDSERLAAAAAKAGAYVVMGANEMDPRPESETVYSSLLLYGPDGSFLGRHRKLMPTAQERSFWGWGDASDLAVFRTEIGNIGMLICGEHTMTLARAALIAQREDFHVSVWHGSFNLTKGPTLVEGDEDGSFFGYPISRSHAVESGAFTLMACTWFDPAEWPEDFPIAREQTNCHHSNGGSAVISPMGTPLAGPLHDQPAILYAACPAWLRKARAAILDTFGHYGRPDLLQLMVHDGTQWRVAGSDARLTPVLRDALRRSAEAYDVADEQVLELADPRGEG